MNALPYAPHELDVHPEGARIRATIDEEIERHGLEPSDDYCENLFDEADSALQALATRAERLVEALEAGGSHADELAALKTLL